MTSAAIPKASAAVPRYSDYGKDEEPRDNSEHGNECNVLQPRQVGNAGVERAPNDSGKKEPFGHEDQWEREDHQKE